MKIEFPKREKEKLIYSRPIMSFRCLRYSTLPLRDRLATLLVILPLLLGVLLIVIASATRLFGPIFGQYFDAKNTEEVNVQIRNIINGNDIKLIHTKTISNNNTFTIVFGVNPKHDIDYTSIRKLVNNRICNVFKIDNYKHSYINIQIDTNTSYDIFSAKSNNSSLILSKIFYEKDCI